MHKCEFYCTSRLGCWLGKLLSSGLSNINLFSYFPVSLARERIQVFGNRSVKAAMLTFQQKNLKCLWRPNNHTSRTMVPKIIQETRKSNSDLPKPNIRKKLNQKCKISLRRGYIVGPPMVTQKACTKYTLTLPTNWKLVHFLYKKLYKHDFSKISYSHYIVKDIHITLLRGSRKTLRSKYLSITYVQFILSSLFLFIFILSRRLIFRKGLLFF